MHSITITRNNKPPLLLVGEVVGNASSKSSGSRKWTDVTIYLTQSKQLVGQIDHRSTVSGDRSVFTKAERFTTGRALIDWLKEDNAGELGGVSNDALSQAAPRIQTIRDAWVEVVK